MLRKYLSTARGLEARGATAHAALVEAVAEACLTAGRFRVSPHTVGSPADAQGDERAASSDERGPGGTRRALARSAGCAGHERQDCDALQLRRGSAVSGARIYLPRSRAWFADT